MKTDFRKSFLRDLKKIKDQDVLNRVRKAILDVEAAASLQEIVNLKKMSGTICFYRLRIGDYRIGVSVGEGTVESNKGSGSFCRVWMAFRAFLASTASIPRRSR